MEHKKGSYVDGHERSDVVEYRQKFLRRLCALGFLNKTNAPIPEAAESLPTDIDGPPDDQVLKTVFLFHDESTFQANDDQSTFWGTENMTFLRPKSKGTGIMVSDFIEEHNGYLKLTDDEYAQAHESIKATSTCLLRVRRKQRRILDI